MILVVDLSKHLKSIALFCNFNIFVLDVGFHFLQISDIKDLKASHSTKRVGKENYFPNINIGPFILYSCSDYFQKNFIIIWKNFIGKLRPTFVHCICLNVTVPNN
ncbi:hypothetical protein BpHYR1_053117 [Brachionus plicatilis]|uniref:Uncharacterized protein n=1 Tax=Brachionus plicatilis TaxID=10195 RepID=A0A3M7S8I6_BRAPC|nr:hypothetical protein BpHYR1_053117 [Brachionus plicatilis]